MDKEKENLLYRPELAPEKYYRSEAEFKRDGKGIPNLPPDEEIPDERPYEIQEDIEEIIKLMKKLPKEIWFWQKSVEKIRDRTKIVWPPGKRPPPIPYTPDDSERTPPVFSDTPGKERPLTSVPDTPGGVTPDHSPGSKKPRPTPNYWRPEERENVPPNKRREYSIPDEIPDRKYGREKTFLPKVKDRYKKEKHIGHIPQESNPFLVNMPDLFPSTIPVKLILETPRTLVRIIKDGYNKDQIQLEQNYLQQLQLIMQRYFQQMIMTMSDCGLSDISQLTEDFDGNYVKIPPGQGLEHLRDEIVRSQIIRNQKARMFKKTHKVDNTLQHLRSWHAAEQQRERYYGEKYKDSGSYVESHSNAILRKVRRDYDKIYSSALYDMYRYLNSSALLTNDILETTVREAQAKAMLLKAGVNIFEKEPVTLSAELGGIAGNSGQAGDGSGSGFDTAPSSSSETSSSEVNTTSEGGVVAPADNTSSQTEISSSPSSDNGSKGIFNNLPDIVMKGSGGGIGGWMKQSEKTLDNLPDIVRKGSGGGIGGWMKQSSGSLENLPDIVMKGSGGGIGGWMKQTESKGVGVFGKIGEYVYKKSGNNLLGAIAGTYVQNRINKGIKIGKVKIDGDGINYGKLSYDGRNIKYGNISYDGKKITMDEKIVGMLEESGYINKDISEIIKAENQEQALNLIREKLQNYVTEKARLEEAFKSGDETSKELISQLAENCRQLLLAHKRLLNGKE